jgi:predicted DNA-binding transcriptional regulator AlpA
VKKSILPRRSGDRFLRPRECYSRLGLGKTAFDEHFIRTGRLRWRRIGARAVGILESEIDALIAEIAAQDSAA